MKELSKKIQEQFDKMCQTDKLFRSSMTGREVCDLYLSSFADENDPIFRDPESSVHNCNQCKNFIRRYGNIVAIDDNYNIMTLFDIELSEDSEYYDSVTVLSKKLKEFPIQDIFFETFNELNSLNYESCTSSQSKFKLGVEKNVKRYTKEEAELYGVVKPNETRIFHHFHLTIPESFVDKSGNSIESIMAEYRDKYNVFKRGIKEIPLDTLLLVKDLINQESLLDGKSHLEILDQFIQFKKSYEELSSAKNIWFWDQSSRMSERLAKFKNTLIGVLCTELAEGEELNKACQNWNKRVDPVNYMKASAPITKRQIEEAKKFVEENGYEESFDRRFTTIDDIKVSEILHSNIGDGEIKKVSVFDNVKSTSTRHKRSQFDNVEEVSIDKFMKDILPSCTSVEAFVENRMENHMVTLTTANNPDSKPIFKWDNNYSWTFNGNLAGKSQIKEAVKAKGGKVDGALRFSIMWAEQDGDNSDLDAHCIEPNGFEIYYGNKNSRRTEGNLDIDITQPKSQMPQGAVENIVYPTLQKMENGNYQFNVHQYASRASKGFKAEIEFDGQIYSYEYARPVTGTIPVAKVTLKDGKLDIDHKLPETSSSREIYGLESNQFHKVNLLCLSPNHWSDNKVGNKHYFFMLDGCKAPNAIRSFHNENLIPELLKHRKVMEVLGATNMIEPSDKQLSGLGFNATVRDELIVKLSGNFKRVIKIKF